MTRLRFLFGLMSGSLLLAAPALAQTKRAAPKKATVARPARDPSAPPLFALAAPFWAPPQAPLAQPLNLKRVFTSSTDNGGDEMPDTVRATFRYVAPGRAQDTTSLRLHDPDDRFYGVFRPNKHAHFRLDEATPFGTVTHYYFLHPPGPAGWFRTTAAAAYPADHPGRPDGARAGFLELEYKAAADVQLGKAGSKTKLLIRQPDTGQLTRYE